MKRLSEAEHLAFEHKQRQYYLQCAKHVLPLAPLPEFKLALDLLERYDTRPTKERREILKKAYRELRKGRGHEFGYTAVGMFYRGLRCILWNALYKTKVFANYDCQSFAEACWCAGHALGISRPFYWADEGALHAERNWQNSLWERLHENQTQEAAA